MYVLYNFKKRSDPLKTYRHFPICIFIMSLSFICSVSYALYTSHLIHYILCILYIIFSVSYALYSLYLIHYILCILYIIHSASYTLYSLYLMHYTLCILCIIYSVSYTSYTLHLIHYVLYFTSYILYTMHPIYMHCLYYLRLQFLPDDFAVFLAGFLAGVFFCAACSSAFAASAFVLFTFAASAFVLSSAGFSI